MLCLKLFISTDQQQRVIPSLLHAQHKRENVERKPASLLVVSLGKAFARILPHLCIRQEVKSSSLPYSLRGGLALQKIGKHRMNSFASSNVHPVN